MINRSEYISATDKRNRGEDPSAEEPGRGGVRAYGLGREKEGAFYLSMLASFTGLFGLDR